MRGLGLVLCAALVGCAGVQPHPAPERPFGTLREQVGAGAALASSAAGDGAARG